MKKDKKIRIKLTDSMGNVSFITVVNGRVSHFGQNMMAHSLSNISNRAAELHFKLEDAIDGSRAIKYVRQYVYPTVTAQLI